MEDEHLKATRVEPYIELRNCYPSFWEAINLILLHIQKGLVHVQRHHHATET